jgi:glycosyltransferase involved in cell wall biosynthesis
MTDVSVIIPTFNRRQDLCVALDSVFQQPDVRVECVVVDDCSDDGTVEHIRARYRDHSLTVIEKPRRSGAQASRNLGMAAAQGEFITFLDSDDCFEPGTLAERVRLCREKNLDALFSGYRVLFAGRRWDLVKNVRIAARSRPADFDGALLDFKISPMITILYRRAAHPALVLDETLASGHDDDLSLRLIRAGRHGFDDILAATIIQHVGERVATPRNLMIGDAQLLRKYADDIAGRHGEAYLMRRRARALAGLWSVGQFGRSSLLRPQKQGSFFTAPILALLYLPLRVLANLRQRVKMSLVRAIL